MEKGGAQPTIKLRPSHRDVGGTLTIKVSPSSVGQASATVFFRPLFHLGDLLPIEGEDVRRDIMLRLNLKPYVLKFLLDGYPGANALLLRK